MNKQHYQLPNDMKVSAKDKYVYLILKYYDGKEGCFPALETLSKNFGLNIKTIRSCIDRLEKAGYIQIKKVGRKHYYQFTKYINFEPFSPEFLKSKEISTGIKVYIIGLQQYMFKDIENIGKLSYTDGQIAKILGVSQSTVWRCNKILKDMGVLYTIPSKKEDWETGCKSDIKIFKMDKLHQEIIWKLQEHEERLDNLDDRVSKLEEQDKIKNKLINKLIEQNQDLMKSNKKEQSQIIL